MWQWVNFTFLQSSETRTPNTIFASILEIRGRYWSRYFLSVSKRKINFLYTYTTKIECRKCVALALILCMLAVVTLYDFCLRSLRLIPPSTRQLCTCSARYFPSRECSWKWNMYVLEWKELAVGLPLKAGCSKHQGLGWRLGGGMQHSLLSVLMYDASHIMVGGGG